MKLRIFYQENNQIKNKIYKRDEPETFPKNIIKIKQIKNLKDYFNISLSSYDEVVDLFKELSIILNTNLSLDQSIDILLQGNKDKKIQEVLITIQDALENAQPIHKALKKHKDYIKDLPILFFQLGIENGDIKNSINILSKILIENQKSKKQFVSALTYPIILIVTLFISVGIIFNFVIPQFEHIFSHFGSNLPFATKALLFVKNFVEKYYLMIFFFFGFAIVVLKYIYIRNKIIFDKFIALHIPLVSKLYCNFILYRFFLSLGMLVKSNYQFQTALKNTMIIIDNKYILYHLNQIVNAIKNGSAISEAFKKTKLFDNLTIRLLHTAQETNTLPDILINITDIYSLRLDEKIKYFSSTIGPLFILILSAFTLWIVLAVMLPSLNIGNILN